VTDAEVERQKAILLEAIESEPTLTAVDVSQVCAWVHHAHMQTCRAVDASLGLLCGIHTYRLARFVQVSILQYNSPLTVPWRRRNEVAVVVTEAAPATTPAVVSWYDTGMRL